ncbi:hypothetical protein [Peribacillus asahii]|uniref:hypothetical protein n=1 Tax=Peribacillus asahii TaxID=228899 RepID=UPI0037FC2557
MKNITLTDIEKAGYFWPLTQGEEESIAELLIECNKRQSKIKGFIETRKNILHNRFDREVLLEIIDLAPHFDKKNAFLVQMAKSMIEKVSRDIVRDYMVADIIESVNLKIGKFNGDVTKVADCIEKYYTCGKLVTMAQTWREREEEVEKGEIIYYEPDGNHAV